MLMCIMHMVGQEIIPLSLLFLSNQKRKLILHIQLLRPCRLPKSRGETTTRQTDLFFFEGISFTFSDRWSDIRGTGVCISLTETLGAVPVCRSLQEQRMGTCIFWRHFTEK